MESPWHSRASELTDWTIDRLVMRWVRYGIYIIGDGKERLSKKTSEMEVPYNKGEICLLTSRRKLTRQRLIRHFRATEMKDVLGLHPIAVIAGRSVVKSGCFDVDAHNPSHDRDRNWRLTKALYERLCEMGFKPLLTDSNGKGGYHLRVLFNELVSSERIYNFGHWLIQDWEGDKPEFFPKQATVTDDPAHPGNWVRIPGRHYKTDHWSRIYDGSRWLDGTDAANYILSLKGDSPNLISNDADTFVPPKGSKRSGKQKRSKATNPLQKEWGDSAEHTECDWSEVESAVMALPMSYRFTGSV